jgi:hypothetical protein
MKVPAANGNKKQWEPTARSRQTNKPSRPLRKTGNHLQELQSTNPDNVRNSVQHLETEKSAQKIA